MRRVFPEILVFIAVILAVRPLSAEPAGSPIKQDEALNVRLFFNVPLLPVTIKPAIGEHETPGDEQARQSAKSKYFPSLRGNIGLGLSYAGFGASYSTEVVTFTNEATHGESSYQDWRLYFYTRKFGADMVGLYYSGFHLSDPEKHGYAADDIRVKRTDMSMKTIGLNLYYIFSDDFSFKAAFTQTERQTKWDYTFLLMLSGMHYSINSKYSLISPCDEETFGGNSGFYKGNFDGVALCPGFGITIPYHDYFATAVAFFGSGYMHRIYSVDSGKKIRHDGFYRINIRSSIGYNGPHFYGGLTFIFDSMANYSGLRVLNNSYLFEVFTGYRL